jgi:hypothetical protein
MFGIHKHEVEPRKYFVLCNMNYTAMFLTTGSIEKNYFEKSIDWDISEIP